jgi:renalase
MSDIQVDVLVVGAGMSGLLAASVLQKNGVRVTVLDKGRSVGGRLATRRIGSGRADHGAQFFTVRTPEFQTWVDQWLEDGVIFVWSYGFSDGSLFSSQDTEGHPRYATHGGMNALAKHVARDVTDIQLNQRIVTATCDEEGWILQNEDGDLVTGKVLLVTIPVPQALPILDEGATDLAPDDAKALRAIEYAPSLTGMFWVEGRVLLPPPGAVQRKNSNVMWVADNQQKGISASQTVVTVQCSERYSQQMWSAPDGRILNAMRADLQLFLRENAKIREAQLKRWRYATPLTPYPERCLVADNDPLLVFAGDAFGGPRVEGAALSGLAAADAILKQL